MKWPRRQPAPQTPDEVIEEALLSDWFDRWTPVHNMPVPLKRYDRWLPYWLGGIYVLGAWADLALGHTNRWSAPINITILTIIVVVRSERWYADRRNLHRVGLVLGWLMDATSESDLSRRFIQAEVTLRMPDKHRQRDGWRTLSWVYAPGMPDELAPKDKRTARKSIGLRTLKRYIQRERVQS